jgi:hypothetical protein
MGEEARNLIELIAKAMNKEIVAILEKERVLLHSQGVKLYLKKLKIRVENQQKHRRELFGIESELTTQESMSLNIPFKLLHEHEEYELLNGLKKYEKINKSLVEKASH